MKSFLQGKKAISDSALRPPSGAVSPSSAVSGGGLRTTANGHNGHSHAPTRGTASSAAGGATVEVVKEGDKVVRLVVICSCGERVEVECLYPAGM